MGGRGVQTPPPPADHGSFGVPARRGLSFPRVPVNSFRNSAEDLSSDCPLRAVKCWESFVSAYLSYLLAEGSPFPIGFFVLF